MRKCTKIIYRDWNKEVFILQGKNTNDEALIKMANKFSELYSEYNIVVIPKGMEFEIR